MYISVGKVYEYPVIESPSTNIYYLHASLSQLNLLRHEGGRGLTSQENAHTKILDNLKKFLPVTTQYFSKL